MTCTALQDSEIATTRLLRFLDREGGEATISGAMSALEPMNWRLVAHTIDRAELDGFVSVLYSGNKPTDDAIVYLLDRGIIK